MPNTWEQGYGKLFGSVGNPNDPNQQRRWMQDLSRQSYQQGANVGMFDQLDPKTLAMFQQLFGQQRSNLQGQQTNALNQAGRSSGAYAASRGYDNPFSFQQRAQGNVFDAYAPQFGQLEANQGENLLNATSQSNQFKRSGLFGLGGAQFQDAQFQEQMRQFMEQMNNSPGAFERIMSGLIQGGATVGGAAIAASDVRLKKNIRSIGKTNGGINLYAWDWKFGGKSFGVIAQELQRIIPDAVYDIGGLLFVDYSKVC